MTDRRKQFITKAVASLAVSVLLIGRGADPACGGNGPATPQGKIVAGTGSYQQIQIIDTVGQTVSTVPLPEILQPGVPAWSPDGEWMTFAAWTTTNVYLTQIYVVRPDGSGLRRVSDGTRNVTNPDFSPDGTKIAFTGVDGPLFIANFDGSGTINTGVQVVHSQVDWSPDGQKILFENWGFTYTSDLLVYDIPTGTVAQLTHHQGAEAFHMGAWSPDGTKIVCIRWPESASNWRVCVMNADGSNPVDLISDWTSNQQNPAWSPDGQYILFSSDQDGHYDIWAMWADGSGRTNLTQSTQEDFMHPDMLQQVLDADGDGVPDASDQCPNTPAGEVVNAVGCSISQLVPASWPWKNHGEYVSAVAEVAREFMAEGLITGAQMGEIVSAAARSDVGKAKVKVPANMVLIPAGSFTMGNCMDPGEGAWWELPLHTVTVSAFYMERYEVTEALWASVYQWATNHGYAFDNVGSSYLEGWLSKGPGYPVIDINWYDTVKWCNARSEKEGLTLCYHTDPGLTAAYKTGQVTNPYVNWSANGYRLPTEAEWEKAARGGTSGHRLPWSDVNTITQTRANYSSWWSGGVPGNPYDLNPTEGWHPTFAIGDVPFTSPVGYFEPNDYGLYDMAGNVQEWCWDWFEYAHYSWSAGSDPHGPASGEWRVLRGGAWHDNAYYLRCASRNYHWPSTVFFGFGFRCARGA
jgi:formylglycine-generating enzyme